MLTKEEHDILNRIEKYEGKDFDTCRLTNPNITKREAIFLANAIKKLNHDSDKSNMFELKEILSDTSAIRKGFNIHMVYGEYDSWGAGYDSMAESGWKQCAKWVLTIIQKMEEHK